MNCTRTLRSLRFILMAGLLMIFVVSSAYAEQMKGSFSLPSDTYWAEVLLAAGDYTFTLDTMGQSPIALRTPDGRTIYRLVTNTESINTSAKSQLVVINSTIQKPTVHILYLSEVKKAFHFQVPHRYEVTSRILARSGGPTEVQHIPVVISGN